jgi:hypothetical protein
VVIQDGNHPVHGLRADYFTLLEERQPQITAFFEPHFAPADADAMARTAAPQQPAMPPHTFTGRHRAPNTDSVTVLLLDALNTSAADALTMRTKIIRTVAKLPPGGPHGRHAIQLDSAAGTGRRGATEEKRFMRNWTVRKVE